VEQVAVHDSLRGGDVLVGDRAFCSFCHIELLNRRGVFCCFRLHQKRPGQASGMVRWKRRCVQPAWMSQQQFDSMPRELHVRIVRQVIEQAGYRSKVVLVATTLLDKKAWPDERIAELYRQRWQIDGIGLALS
jgi:putative transposase